MENGSFVPKEFANFNVGGESPVQVENPDHDKLVPPEMVLGWARDLGLTVNPVTGRLE